MSSLSKACFVFKSKGKARTSKTSPMKQRQSSVDESNHVPDYRLTVFKKAWKSIERHIEILHSETHGNVLGDLLDFIEGASKEMDRWRSSQIIPTAALIAGVNVSDHNAVFATLRSEIIKRVTPHVVHLTSKDATNIKVLIKKLVASLLTVGFEAEGETEHDELEDHSSIKRNRLTMPVLASWYSTVVTNSGDDIHSNFSTPTKRRKLVDVVRTVTGASPRKISENVTVQLPAKSTVVVVIILKDLEAFPSDVLQRFVAILNEYFDRVPFALVFGLSSSASTVHDILTRSTSSKLAVEAFRAKNPSSYLDAVLKNVIVIFQFRAIMCRLSILISNKFHFKLGLKVFRLLEDVFLFNNLSVKTFICGYKFCLMEHYFDNPLSVLCCKLNSVDKRIKTLDMETIERIRRLGSFRNYVEKQSLSEQRDLLLDDARLKSVLRGLLHDIHSYHEDFFPMLYCLHAIVSELPRFPLGKQLRETYSICLERDIADTQEFLDCINLLNLMAKDELMKLLTQGRDAIYNYNLPSLAISKIRRSLDDIMERMDMEQPDIFDNECPIAKGVTVEQSKNALPKRMDRYELQQRLKSEMAAQNNRRRPTVTFYSSLRQEAIDVLKQATKRFLLCPKRFPLHEIFYYDTVTTVQPKLIGGSRAALQIALYNPHSYLKCECCSLEDDGSILGTFPDICITYKLHLECGRLINLYDWFQAFIMIVEQADENSTLKSNVRKPSDKLMARFIRSVAELQFLGFVKSTTRKTDHVARLTCYLIKYIAKYDLSIIIDAHLKKSMLKMDDTKLAHAGIPQALFVEDVDSYMKLSENSENVEQVLTKLDEQHSKYKFMELNLLQKRRRLKSQIPDIKSSLDIVRHMKSKQESPDDIDTHFLLSDQVYVKAKIPPTDRVCLWLGANVMLEYTMDDAESLLSRNLEKATKNLSQLEDDLDFLRDQFTTTEVNMARVYNWDVKRRQSLKSNST